MNGKTACICETENLEEGDRLYKLSNWEGGYDFYRIEIKYCPVCGKRLPNSD